MRMQRAASMMALTAVAIGVGLLGAGCPKERAHNERPPSPFSHDDYPHNMARVKCRSQTDKKDVSIEVKADENVLGKRDDRAVFVCQGENVFWYTTQKDVTFEVNFSGPGANTIFKDGLVKFQSEAVDPATHNDMRQMTKAGVMVATEFYAHKYSIVATDEQKKTWPLDPHVIPMGK